MLCNFSRSAPAPLLDLTADIPVYALDTILDAFVMGQ